MEIGLSKLEEIINKAGKPLLGLYLIAGARQSGLFSPVKYKIFFPVFRIRIRSQQ